MYIAMKCSNWQLCHALLSWYHTGIPLTCFEVNQLMTTTWLGFCQSAVSVRGCDLWWQVACLRWSVSSYLWWCCCWWAKVSLSLVVASARRAPSRSPYLWHYMHSLTPFSSSIRPSYVQSSFVNLSVSTGSVAGRNPEFHTNMIKSVNVLGWRGRGGWEMLFSLITLPHAKQLHKKMF